MPLSPVAIAHRLIFAWCIFCCTAAFCAEGELITIPMDTTTSPKAATYSLEELRSGAGRGDAGFMVLLGDRYVFTLCVAHGDWRRLRQSIESRIGIWN